MKTTMHHNVAKFLLLLACIALLSACERPVPATHQQGYRGTGMVDVQNSHTLPASKASNAVPVALPAAGEGGPPASAAFQNLKVLGGVSVGEFTRTMLAMTNWVSPTEGCAYCHNLANMASDEKYAKVVSRRMIEMTQHINTDWTKHVGATGVTCYTCHRGNPVPSQIWFAHLEDVKSKFAGNRGGQNLATPAVGLTSLPYDPFTTFLQNDTEIRTVAATALPSGDHRSIKQTEWSYALMMHISKSLGVNCTFCHNSRSFTDWDQSSPARATAWYGIRLVRDLNNAYLGPLASTLPAVRHGPTGDGPKVNCATCHQGINKPLYGVSMLQDYAVFRTHVDAPPPPPPPSTNDNATPPAADVTHSPP
jgi:photosynthetic reaction center cytochrome c subunit